MAINGCSNLHMDVELENWENLPAEKLHEYLERYVDKFQLRHRCRLNTKVILAERDELRMDAGAVWKVQVETHRPKDHHTVRQTLLCDILIVATVTSSTTSLPNGIIDWATFQGPILHSKDMGIGHQQQ